MKDRRTRPRIRTRTAYGVPAPLHLPSDNPMAQTREFGEKMGIPHEPDDTIVVDVEVNAAGQIVITGAERGS